MADQNGLPEMILAILNEAPDNRLFTSDELVLAFSEYGYNPMPSEAEVRAACDKINQKLLVIAIRQSRIVGIEPRVAIGLKRKNKRLPPKAIQLPNVRDVPHRPKKKPEDNSWLAWLDRYLNRKLQEAFSKIRRRQSPAIKHKRKNR